LFFLAVWFVPWGIRSLHGEYMVIAFPGLALCVSAILAEAASRVIGALRARRQHR
jgi:hypothetical protein